MTVIVVTRWPGLVDAIKRAGHEPVVIVDDTPEHPTLASIVEDVFKRELLVAPPQQSTFVVKRKK
jgi:hypothetical protein